MTVRGTVRAWVDAALVYDGDASGVDIGRSYGVSPNTVYAIRNRRSWKCLSA